MRTLIAPFARCLRRTNQAGRFTLLAAAGALACVSSAGAGPVQTVYAIAPHVPTSPKSAVPGGLVGIADARFNNWNNRFFRTAKSKQWYVVAGVNSGDGATDNVLVLGSGLSGTVIAREGFTKIRTTGAMVDEFFVLGQSASLYFPRINDAGQWAVGFRLNVAGATAADDRLVRWNGTGFDMVALPGDPCPAIAPETWGGSFTVAGISSTGDVSFLGVYSGHVTPDDSAFGANGTTVLAQMATTVPGGQFAAWADIDTNTLFSDDSGTHWIAQGEVNSANNKVVVVDGVVVIQQGFAITGMAPTALVTGVTDVFMEPNGDWFARGTSLDGAVSTTWVVRNGAVIALSGQPIVPGSTETWETFKDMKGDNAGHWVINGNTNASSLTDDVLVLDGAKVVARESDGVDLDGNGAADDSFFMHQVQDRITVPGDGFVYFPSRIKVSATGTTGAGSPVSNNAWLLRSALCYADFNYSGVVSIDDIFLFLNAWFAAEPRANFDQLGGVTIDDIFIYLNAWFTGC